LNLQLIQYIKMVFELKQINKMEIATFSAGYRRLIKKLVDNGFEIKEVLPLNDRRYTIVFGKEKNILVIYKRDPFFNFGLMFRKEGQSGVGDTINVLDLKIAIQSNVKEIYSIFPNGKAYKIDLLDFLRDSFRWKNHEGKSVRSISIHKYKECLKI